MMLCIPDVLTREELDRIRAALVSVEFIDGRATTGVLGRRVKNNRQLPRESEAAKALAPIVETALRRHYLFDWAVWPKRIDGILFSRYDLGMHYGPHIDNALMGPSRTMGGGSQSRSDVAFTVFLSNPTEYDGGELVIESPLGPQEVKLAAGEAVIYPASTLHRVADVTRGSRLVAVGWVQSLVRDPVHREILYDLERLKRFVTEKIPGAPEATLLFKTQSNLLRLWAEP
jgi:PKHD-type hydroxylase